MVQWLGLRAFIAEGPGSVPGQGTKISQTVQCGRKKQKNKTKKQNQKQTTFVKVISLEETI